MGDGERFVWHKRQGREPESVEQSRQELYDIQRRRRRQEELWRQRQLAREETRFQETEAQGIESEFEENAFEYQTLRNKAQSRDEKPWLMSAIFNLYIFHLSASHLLDKPVNAKSFWTFESPFVYILGSTAKAELQSGISTCNRFLENLVILKELAERHPGIFSQRERAFGDGNLVMWSPRSPRQLNDEYAFWLNVKTAMLGELWERQDTEGALTDVTRTELRELVSRATTKDVWDLGRMISLQLHYASTDEKVDVDFWEAIEKRYPWISSTVWIADIHRELRSQGPEIRKIEAEVGDEVTVQNAKDEEGEPVEQEEPEDDYGASFGRSFLVDGENPNDLFDRLVIREKASEACDSQNTMQGGEFEQWQAKGSEEKKPRYFNRIKLIHEWHKYNQVHYDIDNPPPKSVQGYKFILCYPNARDKPSWNIEEDKSPDSDGSTVLLRFHAAGYKDVGFRIIKREWDLNTKNGFKNFYENGILILSFTFKRNRYRK